MPILCASQAPSYAWNLAGRLGFEIISIIQTSLPLARYKINRPSSNTWSLLILQNFMFKRLVTCTSTIYLDMSTRLDTQTGTVSLTTKPNCLLSNLQPTTKSYYSTPIQAMSKHWVVTRKKKHWAVISSETSDKKHWVIPLENREDHSYREALELWPLMILSPGEQLIVPHYGLP